MTIIGNNLRKIRNVKGLSQKQFAEIFNIKRSSVGAYEEGRAHPKQELLVNIANYFSISIDRLLTREITVNELSQYEKISDKYLQSTNFLTSEKNGYTEIPLVKANLFHEYKIHPDKSPYLENLPKISFPFNLRKIEIAFEVAPEINVLYETIHEGDYIFCTELTQKMYRSDFEERMFIVGNDFSIISTFKFEQQKGYFTTVSDESVAFQIDEVVKSFKIMGIINLHISKNINMEYRLLKLEEQIKKLNKYLK